MARWTLSRIAVHRHARRRGLGHNRPATSKRGSSRSRFPHLEILEERALLSAGGPEIDQSLATIAALSASSEGASWAAEVDRPTEDTWLADVDSYLPMPLPVAGEPVPDAGPGLAVSHDCRTGKETVHAATQISGTDGATVLGDPGVLGQWLSEFETDPDDRYVERNFSALSRVYDQEEYPWRVNCKIFMDFNGHHYVGSGVLIDSMHVLTAGHCVYSHDSGEGGWADSITVVPAYEDGAKPYGEAHSAGLHSWTGWTEDESYSHDIGVIDLDRPIGALTGWYGYAYNNSESFFLGHTFHNPGYPAESPYDGRYMYDWYGDFDYFIPFTNEVGITREGYGGQSGSGANYNDDGSRYVYAVLSNGAGDFENFIRLTEGKFKDIRDDFIPDDTPSTFDLIPLDVNVSPAAVNSGAALSSLSYVVHNYSSAAWSGTVTASIYLSTNNDITTSDILLGTDSFTQSFSAKGTVTRSVSSLPTIPVATTTGDYYIGVILTTADYSSSNNDTDGWDAATLHVDHVNQVPTLSALPNRSLNEDATLDNTIDLWNYAADLETTDSGLTFTITGNTDAGCGVSIDANRYIDIRPTANWYGTSDVTIRVTDAGALFVEDTFRITVNPVNDAPVLIALSDLALAEDGSLNNAIDLWARASDVETADASLVFSIVADTSPDCGVSIDSGRYIDVAPTANWSGTSDVTIRVTDGGSLYAQDTFRVTVTPVNDAPVAMAEAYACNEDGVLIVYPYDGVLINDVDTDGPAALTAVLQSGAAHGTLTLDPTGWIRYQPNPNYHGTDSFTYKTFDGVAYSAAATVTLAVASVNDAPVAVADAYTCLQGGTIIRYPYEGFLINDTDADNSDGDPDNDVQLNHVAMSTTSRGTLLLYDRGAFSYTPADDFYGIDSFTYRATDGHLQSTTTTVVITVLQRLAGDANNDGAVNNADAALMAAHWGLAGMSWDDGDFNGDGKITAADAAILAANWGLTRETAELGPAMAASRDVLVGPVPTTRTAARATVRPLASAEAASFSQTAHDVALAAEYGPQPPNRADSVRPAAARLARSRMMARRLS